MKYGYLFKVAGLATAVCLSGCDFGSSSVAELSSFVLYDLEASSSDVKTMTLTWDAASENSGVTYSVCETDTSQDNDCSLQTTVEDALTATITVDSLVDALSTEYFIMASNSEDETQLSNDKVLTADTATQMIGYFKASSTSTDAYFGYSVALSNDGDVLAVGANQAESTDGVSNAGTVYLFSDTLGVWTLIDSVSASNAEDGDNFGSSVALSSDGSTLVVGAPEENGGSTGVFESTDGLTATTSSLSGAVYVFTNDGDSDWSQSYYIKASDATYADRFGYSVALNSDGTRLAVGANLEDGADTSIIEDSTSINTTGNVNNTGAVYLFDYDTDSGWSQSAYVKSSNSGAGDQFGQSVAFSDDGLTLAVGAIYEDASDDGVSTSASTDDSASGSGAVYLFNYDSGWSQSYYIKASNSQGDDQFGTSVALSGDGATLAVGAIYEDGDDSSIITDSDAISTSDNQTDSGAVYLFSYSSDTWSQSAYIKASNVEEEDYFGSALALSSDGSVLVVGAYGEDGDDSGIITDSDDISTSDNQADSGAVYLFSYSSDTWSQSAYIKASNTDADDYFGYSAALSNDGTTLAVGAYFEDNSVSGVISDGSEIDGDTTSTDNSGAVYLY